MQITTNIFSTRLSLCCNWMMHTRNQRLCPNLMSLNWLVRKLQLDVTYLGAYAHNEEILFHQGNWITEYFGCIRIQ